MNTATLWRALQQRLSRTAASPKPPLWDDTQALEPQPEVPNTLPRDTGAVFDSQFDSRLDSVQLNPADLREAHADLIYEVLRGRADNCRPTFSASYGPEANVRFDFRARLAFVDPKAQRQLRVERQLPLPAAGLHTGADAIVRELDEVLWDLGVAAGPYRPMGAPEAWWHTPLHLALDVQLTRYTRLPRHLEMGHILAQGPVTPSALRRRAQVSVGELRCFLQAGLMLGLLNWTPCGLEGRADFLATPGTAP